MNTKEASNGSQADPAAIFAGALSIWNTCHEREARNPALDLSDTFSGIDGLMRVSMAIATIFEEWSCRHVDFDRLEEWWPYKLESEMGEACLSLMELDALPAFDEKNALDLAVKLKLPLKAPAKGVAPLYIRASNPLQGARFRTIYIQSVREALDGSGVSPLAAGDSPADVGFGPPFYGIYGIDPEGYSEHIADRRTLDAAFEMVKGLIPGLQFARKRKPSPNTPSPSARKDFRERPGD